ncbi:MAG: hypothetical protein ACRDO0_20250 [Nocardioidaceae bacterium]
MTSATRSLLRRLLVVGVAVVALGALLSVPTASATVGRTKDREGSCRAGPGTWDLQVKARPHHRIRIRFEVDDIGRRQRWQVFITNKGHRVASVTRRSGRSGEIQVTRRARNRKGRDRVRAAAVNPRTGSICIARLRF